MIAIKFWGTRGSIATPGKSTVKYGGNTACVEVRIGNQILVIDAGTGIRNLGNQLIKTFPSQLTTVHILISHTHWDHIQGFPFFMPAYAKNFQLMIYGPPARDKSLRELLKMQMDPEYFPVPLGDLNSQINMQEVREPFWIGEIKVEPFYLNHPAMTLGYKIISNSKSVTYASDNEPYKYTLHAARKEQTASQYGTELDQKFIDFITNTDLLIIEAQYTLDEYKSKIGWGHSPIESVIEFAIKAKVKQIVLFHHDPSHDDMAVDALVRYAQRLIESQKAPIKCIGAEEGLEIKLE